MKLQGDEVADNLVQQYGSWLLLIVVFGSLVDLFQFSWIIKRHYLRYKRNLYNKIRREVLLTEYEKKVSGER